MEELNSRGCQVKINSEVYSVLTNDKGEFVIKLVLFSSRSDGRIIRN